MAADAPLPSSESAAPADEPAAATTVSDAPARPPAPTFKFSTFVYTFLFGLGIIMVFDADVRNSVGNALMGVLVPTIGFGGQYILLTMFVAAVLEMLITAIASNATTDWIKAAKVQSWGAALRKVQMPALRSGKKDRIEALQPHQQRLARLSGEVSISQMKGMAITWFLVIAIYTWMGLYILQLYNLDPVNHHLVVVNLGGAAVDLYKPYLGGFVPPWFLLFTLYTVPSSLLFRRLFKHRTLKGHPDAQPSAGASPVATAGRA